MRKTDEYLMQAAIVANPSKQPDDAQEFIETLMDQRRFMRGEDEVPAELDVGAFDGFKKQLEKESKMLGVK